jgi:hypothetical protein
LAYEIAGGIKVILPNHSPFHSRLLDLYIRRILHRDFHEIRIVGELSDIKHPVLLIPNHISWWDGFFAWHLNRKLFHKRFHIMMLEKELATRMFFSRIGAFSINKSGRGVVDSLNFASKLLQDNQNIVVFFPQGKIESMFTSPINFEKGVERVLSNARDATIVFCCTLIDYTKNRRPTVSFFLKQYQGNNDLKAMESAYNQHLAESVHLQIQTNKV